MWTCSLSVTGSPLSSANLSCNLRRKWKETEPKAPRRAGRAARYVSIQTFTNTSIHRRHRLIKSAGNRSILGNSVRFDGRNQGVNLALDQEKSQWYFPKVQELRSSGTCVDGRVPTAVYFLFKDLQLQAHSVCVFLMIWVRLTWRSRRRHHPAGTGNSDLRWEGRHWDICEVGRDFFSVRHRPD